MPIPTAFSTGFGLQEAANYCNLFCDILSHISEPLHAPAQAKGDDAPLPLFPESEWEIRTSKLPMLHEWGHPDAVFTGMVELA